MATCIAIRICLHVPLVVQTVEWFFAADVSEVEQDLVPEACIQKVQHSMFHAADIQVDTAGVSFALWTHPVLLDCGVNERFSVCWVEITHLIPTRTSPLRHHVDFTAVLACTITKIQGDCRPFLHARKWWHRVTRCVVRVKCGGFEVGKFWKQHRKCAFRNCVCIAQLVVDDGEWFTPVALT